jgi:hypothetical protein
MASDEARFWSYVDRRGLDECWLWQGTMRGPYGQFKIQGKTKSAHVVAWEIDHNELLPPGIYGLHSCNNPRCVNPQHIYPGTQSENIQTSVKLGTHRNIRKTHCDHGHELTEENTYRRANQPNRRECRICRRARKGK